MMKSMVVVLLLISINTWSNSTSNFGDSCLSKGQWTNRALDAGDQLQSVINELAKDPNCAAISAIYAGNSLPRIQGEPNGPDDEKKFSWFSERGRELQMPGETFNISTLLSSYQGSTNGDALVPAIMSSMIKESFSSPEFTQRMGETYRNSLSYVNNTAKAFMSRDIGKCLHNQPQNAIKLASSSIGLLSGLVGYGYNSSVQLADTVNNLVDSFRKSTYINETNMLNDEKYKKSIACLIETTAEAYCKAKDAQSIVYQSQNRPLSKEALEESLKRKIHDPSYPLEGFLVLSRDVTIVQQWIQDLQFGVQPRLTTDAEYKNNIWSSVIEVVKDKNTLLADYNDTAKRYEAATTLEQKRMMLAGLVAKLVRTMGRDYGASVNFFEESVNLNDIPYYLIGRTGMPDIAKPNDARDALPFDNVFRYKGPDNGWMLEFITPDALLRKIKIKLDEIIETATFAMSKYFQQRLIIDKSNLLDRSLTDYRISVYEALENIKAYLEKLNQRALIYIMASKTNTVAANKKNDLISLNITANISNTIEKIDRITSLYKLYFKRINDIAQQASLEQEDYKLKSKQAYEVVKKLLANDDQTKLDPKFKNKEQVQSLKELEGKILETIYTEFNVLFQRDTFLLSRIGSFFEFDIRMRMKQLGTFDQYQDDLIAFMGSTVYSGMLNESHGTNPQLISDDLSSAITIHKENLLSLGRLFTNPLSRIIREVKDIEQANRSDYIGRKKSAIRKFLLDWFDSPDAIGLAKPIYLSFFKKDQYDVIGQYSHFDDDKRETIYRDFRNTRGKLCLQSLALPSLSSLKDFKEGCGGSYIQSIDLLDQEGRSLSAYYDEYLNANSQALDKKKGDYHWANFSDQESNNICAYRDFVRRNQIHYLMRSYEN